MKFFASKKDINDINDEILRVILKEHKVHIQSDMDELKKTEKEKEITEKFKELFQKKDLKGLFNLWLDLVNDLPEDVVINFYFLCLFYVDQNIDQYKDKIELVEFLAGKTKTQFNEPSD